MSHFNYYLEASPVAHQIKKASCGEKLPEYVARAQIEILVGLHNTVAQFILGHVLWHISEFRFPVNARVVIRVIIMQYFPLAPCNLIEVVSRKERDIIECNDIKREGFCKFDRLLYCFLCFSGHCENKICARSHSCLFCPVYGIPALFQGNALAHYIEDFLRA